MARLPAHISVWQQPYGWCWSDAHDPEHRVWFGYASRKEAVAAALKWASHAKP